MPSKYTKKNNANTLWLSEPSLNNLLAFELCKFNLWDLFIMLIGRVPAIYFYILDYCYTSFFFPNKLGFFLKCKFD
jgi:hypothetical protein